MNDKSNSNVELAGMTLLVFDSFETAFPVFGDQSTTRRRFATLLVDENNDRQSGGSGFVCRACNVTGETFALKRLHMATGIRSEEAERQQEGRVAAFREEYTTQLVLSHLRGFPAVYGYGTIKDTPAILMEWIEGVSLRDAARRLGVKGARTPNENRKGIPGRLVARIGLSVADMLLAAETLDESFIHRDLSPTNIMICTKLHSLEEQVATGHFDIRIIDFGSAMFDTGGNQPTFTQRTDVWRNGTPAYAAPEMLTRDLEGSESLRRSPSIDVYALCSVLYELYAGRTPYLFDADPHASPYLIKRRGEPDPLTPHETGDEPLVHAILAGIRSEQAYRIALRDLRDRLASWLGMDCDAVDDPTFQRARAQALTHELQTHGANWKVSQEVSGQVQTATADAPRRVSAATRPMPSTSATPVTRTYSDGPQTNRTPSPHAAAPQGSRQQNPQHSVSNPQVQGAQRPLSRRLMVVGGIGAVAALTCAGAAWGIKLLLESMQRDHDTSSGATTPDEPQSSTEPDNASSSKASAHLADPKKLVPAQDADTDLWGYVSAEGAWIVAPTWEKAPGFFSGGLAAAWDSETGFWGYINTDLTWVIDPSFQTALPFTEEGHAPVQDAASHLWGIIDQTSAWTTSPSFAEICPFSQNMAAAQALDTEVSADLARYGQTWGYLDTAGSWVIEPSYAEAATFGASDVAPVATSPQSWQFISKEGEIVWDEVWSGAQPFHEGFAAVLQGSSKRWGYIDESGELLIDYTFDDALPFFDGVAPVLDRETARWGLINTAGVWVVSPRFSEMKPFNEATGLAGACDEKTGLWGLVDTEGAWVVEPLFSAVTAV